MCSMEIRGNNHYTVDMCYINSFTLLPFWSVLYNVLHIILLLFLASLPLLQLSWRRFYIVLCYYLLIDRYSRSCIRFQIVFWLCYCLYVPGSEFGFAWFLYSWISRVGLALFYLVFSLESVFCEFCESWIGWES